MGTNVYGDKGGNNAGEYLAVDPNDGDVMVFVDSDTLGGAMGFLKLTSNGSPPTTAPPTPLLHHLSQPLMGPHPLPLLDHQPQQPLTLRNQRKLKMTMMMTMMTMMTMCEKC